MGSNHRASLPLYLALYTCVISVLLEDIDICIHMMQCFLVSVLYLFLGVSLLKPNLFRCHTYIYSHVYVTFLLNTFSGISQEKETAEKQKRTGQAQVSR